VGGIRHRVRDHRAGAGVRLEPVAQAGAQAGREVGWDDVFRYLYVRGLTVSAAWGPAVFLLFLDDMMSLTLSDSPTFSSWPYQVVAVGATVLYLVFRQGRHLWKRAWLQRTPAP
jgi:hypothetical protein